MLVLSRYKDQSIYIGDDIVVTVVDVRGDRIRLGVEAPPDVPVHRQEIYEEIHGRREKTNVVPNRRDVRKEKPVVVGSCADFEMQLR
ncbi:MAG: carbon storage regulator CsrA [Thermoguttaceae bacterium]|jgi:carbon storage regulator|nr:carbon storage regulator CsrA [Thermoguttaceae bacterium]MBR4751244.1 carbon storage regulator CsrA [Thermoguttaceae bacterium]MBR5757171.1 carbon storage regulator CsrA [Thermoguttaceae bacterium]